MKTSIIKMLLAVAVFAMPATAHVSTYQPLNYTTIFYGDFITHEMGEFFLDFDKPLSSVPYVVHNKHAEVGGDVCPDGWQIMSASVEGSSRTLSGNIDLFGEDGVEGAYPYNESCGKSSVVIIGSWTPRTIGFSSGTPLFMNMSVTPYGNNVGDFENFYFKMFNENQLLTELSANRMVDTVYFNAGDRLSFEMYALEDDFYNDGRVGYDRDFRYSAVVGSPATVPVPGSMLLGSLGIGAVGMLRKRLQRA